HHHGSGGGQPGKANGRHDSLARRRRNPRADRQGSRIRHPGVAMTFDNLLAGADVFLDANTLIYHFSNHPKYGAACTRLVERIELHEIRGLTSSHCLADVAHRLMTIEAMGRLGWP